ncbi:nucleotide-diphospho-sugar transferase [Imleria badia]|nr:nucleotide-diphospho-sugar transferase [Imleria badia]
MLHQSPRNSSRTFQVVTSVPMSTLDTHATTNINIASTHGPKDDSRRLDDTTLDTINIALAIDSGYAMPGAVTLRSIADSVKGPVMIYVFDCGLRAEDKQKIEASLPHRLDLTLVFMELPSDTIASKLGPRWTRIDMMKCLPGERLIYLDADILVRKDLRDLWNTDLEGHPIAAARDVVMPMGYAGVPRGEYFNSGVLLMDLVKVRTAFPELETLCFKMRNARYWDQDPLNLCFRGDILWLSLTWNAQVLGTTAEWYDEERAKLSLEQLKDPAIVHFVGPTDPVFSMVLHPYWQPYCAKPWGCGGAPGHPYERDWWDTLEKTVWKGCRETSEWKESCRKAKMKILKKAEDEFIRRTTIELGWCSELHEDPRELKII